MGKPVTDAEKAELIRLYKEGMSYRKMSHVLGRTPSTLHEWIQVYISSGELIAREVDRKPENGRGGYDRQRRIALNDKLFCKLEKLICATDDPVALKNHIVSYGILEDKRQKLEPGMQVGGKSGLEEIREALKNGMETAPTEQQGSKSLD